MQRSSNGIRQGARVTIKAEAVETTKGRLDLLMVRPSSSEPPSRGVLFLHGLSRRPPDGTPEQFLSEARSLAKEGAVVAIPQGQFPWSLPPSGSGDLELVERELTLQGTVLDMLASMVTPPSKSSGLAVVGHDFGGMYALCLAARDSRVRATVSIAPTPRWADWFLRYWPITGDRFEYLRMLSEVDPITAAASRRTPLLLQFGTRDYFIAEMTAHELDEASADPKESRFYRQPHPMTGAQVVRDRREFLLSQLASAR